MDNKYVKSSNNPWYIHADEIIKDFAFKKVVILNDFNATGYGVLETKKDEVF